MMKYKYLFPLLNMQIVELYLLCVNYFDVFGSFFSFGELSFSCIMLIIHI